MTEGLGPKAEDFAGTLNTLFDAAFGVSNAFVVIDVPNGGHRRRIGVAPFGDTGFALFPLHRKVDGETERLFLKIEFDVELDASDEFIQVRTSVFGLFVNLHPKGKRKRPTPVFRIEYDRETTGGKPPAHVHIHAESVEFGWIAGSAGQPLRSHSEIHFPVGGRRFRPTVENLLLFLDREHLFEDWASSGWKDVAKETLRRFEDGQVRATVRHNLETAADQLRRHGYEVTAPDAKRPTP